jgi:hypothetical protein
MIEAVENHMPEVIIIDEIGTELEATAARTIAERGVQLIGTAHGKTLENLLLNPTLSDLVGGIEAVTLSDEEARRRGTQKTVLERRAPPTFDILIEIQARDVFTIHADITEAVDTFLRGFPVPPEIRTRDAEGRVKVEKAPAAVPATRASRSRTSEKGRSSERGSASESGFMSGPLRDSFAEAGTRRPRTAPSMGTSEAVPRAGLQPVKVYPYGVARNRLMQSAKRLGVPAIVVRTIDEADALITLRAHYRDHQATIIDAEHRGMPIYVLRSNTVSQIEQFLTDLFNLPGETAPSNGGDDYVKQSTQTAIASVLNGERYVDMPPAAQAIRRIQHEMAREAELVSHSYGKEPRRHVRIFRD